MGLSVVQKLSFALVYQIGYVTILNHFLSYGMLTTTLSWPKPTHTAGSYDIRHLAVNESVTWSSGVVIFPTKTNILSTERGEHDSIIPRVVVSPAAFHVRVRGSLPGLGGLKETKMFLPHPFIKLSIVGSLLDREVACLESCIWCAVPLHSSQHPQEVLLAQFSLYVHKSGLKPDSLHFYLIIYCLNHERKEASLLCLFIVISLCNGYDVIICITVQLY